MSEAGSQRDIQRRTFLFAVDAVTIYGYLSRDLRPLANQFLRSATSVGANMEEASAASSKPDFINKCNIALKEAREAHYWLRLFIATNLLGTEISAPLLTQANEIISILTTIVRNSKATASRGSSNG